jgi:integrase
MRGCLSRAAAKGEDPAAAKKQERKAENLRELATLYLEQHAKIKKRNWRADHNIIHKDLIPHFGSRKPGDITRREMLDVLKAIKSRGAPIQANRTLEVARKLFNWAISEELVEQNPCHNIGKLSPENQRTRVLSNDEIRLLWAALETRSPLVAAAYRLMLSTGQRSIEVLGAKHAEVGADGWWTIPAGRVKNRIEHRVWLNKIARGVLTGIKSHNQNSEYLFPSRQGGHIRWIQKTHGRLRKVSGLSDFTIHDLRRTAASCMAATGINRLIIAKILNHKERHITAVYDRYGYGPEIQCALDTWAERLSEILSVGDYQYSDQPFGNTSHQAEHHAQ